MPSATSALVLEDDVPRLELRAVVGVHRDAFEDTADLLTLRLVALDANALDHADAVDPGSETGSRQRGQDCRGIHAVGNRVGDGVRVRVSQVRLAPRLLADLAAQVEVDGDAADHHDDQQEDDCCGHDPSSIRWLLDRSSIGGVA